MNSVGLGHDIKNLNEFTKETTWTKAKQVNTDSRLQPDKFKF